MTIGNISLYQKRHLEDLAVLTARVCGAIDDLYPKLDLGNDIKEAVITHVAFRTVNNNFNDMKFRKRYAEEYIKYRETISDHGYSILRP